MTDKRKKLTVYLHPEDDSQDARAMEIIESVPLRTRGDFFRAAIVGGSALYQLDKRLPYLLSMLFDGQLTADQLVGIATSPALKATLKSDIQKEYAKLSWKDIAKKCMGIYNHSKKIGATA